MTRSKTVLIISDTSYESVKNKIRDILCKFGKEVTLAFIDNENKLKAEKTIDQTTQEILSLLPDEKLRFCPNNCEYLTFNEEQQEERTYKGKPQPLHSCMAFNKRVVHNGQHPNILRCEECSNIARAIIIGEYGQERVEYKLLPKK